MGTLSDWGAGANILKSLVGLGVLTLPYATAQVGWLASSLGFAVVAVMSVQGILFAVMAREALEKSVSKDEAQEDSALCESGSDVPDLKLAEHTMGFFDNVVRRAVGWQGQWLYTFSIAVGQLTTAISYVDTIAVSMESYMVHKIRIVTVLVIGAVLTVLSTVKTLTGVSYLSYVGLLTYVVIFVILIFEVAESDGPADGVVALRSVEGRAYGVWFGMAAFAFGGFAISVVVYDDMKEPRHFQWVLSIAYFCCWLFYTSFALLGYVCYGNNAKEVVYFNFPAGSGHRNLTLISICVVLVLTYVLQMMPVYSWVESCTKDCLHYSMARGVCIAFTVLVACIVRDLVATISIGGALSAAISAFVMPSVVYLAACPRASWTDKLSAAALILLGLCGAVRAVIQ